MNALLFLGLLLAAPDPGQLEQEIQKQHRQLEETRRQLEETRQRIESLNQDEEATLARAEIYADQVAATRRYLSQLDAELAARAEQIMQLNRQSEETALKTEARKQDLARRLTAIYKHGLLLRLQAVLNADRVTDAYRRLMHLHWVARADRKSADELSALQARLRTERSQLLAARTGLQSLKDDRLGKQALLEASQRAESTLLAKVRTERGAKQGLERQLDDAMLALQSLIERLERERTDLGSASSYFEQNKGRLPWPVRGKLLSGFGTQVHPKYHTRTNSRGVDISTKPGTAVLAIAPGEVAYADQFMGYGRLVIVDHGAGFYTLHGNLDDFSAGLGAAVEPGSVLGHAKDYLHFEVRRQGQPVDPLAWLSPNPE